MLWSVAGSSVRDALFFSVHGLNIKHVFALSTSSSARIRCRQLSSSARKYPFPENDQNQFEAGLLQFENLFLFSMGEKIQAGL